METTDIHMSTNSELMEIESINLKNKKEDRLTVTIRIQLYNLLSYCGIYLNTGITGDNNKCYLYVKIQADWSRFTVNKLS